MLKANRLTAGQILRFKLGVQQQRAVCPSSCGVQINSLCPECLVSSCRLCKARTKKEQRQNTTKKRHQINLLGVCRWHNFSQMHLLKLSTTMKGFLRHGGPMHWCHTCSFLPAAAYIKIIAAHWVWQRQLQDMNESTQQEEKITERTRSSRANEEFKLNKCDRLCPPDWLILEHLFKVGGNCAEKKRMFRDRQRKTSSVQTSPMEKRKTEHVAHITSLV